jgi:molecular chaperone GrpE (heat shock protein)
MNENLGIKKDENAIYINGVPINNHVKEKIIISDFDESEENNIDYAFNNTDINDLQSLIETLENNDKCLKDEINKFAKKDDTIKELINIANRTDAEYYYALVAPVINQIFNVFEEVKFSYENKDIFIDKHPIKDDLCEIPNSQEIKFYFALLTFLIDKIELILTQAGTSIENPEELDKLKHKIIKTINTDDENLDRKIAKIYSDCYIYDSKIIYHSKVDVYKFQKTE